MTRTSGVVSDRFLGFLQRLAGRREAPVEIEDGATVLDLLTRLAGDLGLDFGRRLADPHHARRAGVARGGMQIFRRRRFWNILFRTLHLTAFGLVLGGAAFHVEPARVTPALIATIMTGALLVMLEIHDDPRWPFLGKGLFVLGKLALLLLVPVFPGGRVPLFVAVVVLAGVGSHMPRWLRHYSVLERRVVDRAATPAWR